MEIEPVILDNACFHCQQAIKKCLKAYLTYHGRDIERTHNIIFLLSQCADFDLEFAGINILDLNAKAVKARYPDLNQIPEVEESKIYYQLALHIRNLVLKKIDFYGSFN